MKLISSLCGLRKASRMSPISTAAQASAAPPAGAPQQPMPMPFAVARNTHEALRGALKDCSAAAIANDLPVLKAEWTDFKRGLDTHMKMEDNGMFPMMNSMFDNVCVKENFGSEHVHDKEEHALVDAAIASGQADKIQSVVAAFVEDHEKHLKHEEDIMMPLTMKAGNTPAERALAVNKHILQPMIDTGDFPWHLEWVIKKLVKHKPAEATRVYVWGLQYASTPDQYATFLPIIKSVVPADAWEAMDKQFELSGPGKITSA